MVLFLWVAGDWLKAEAWCQKGSRGCGGSLADLIYVRPGCLAEVPSAGREPGKALLGLAFIQARIFPSGYGVFGRKSSVFWQNGTRQAVNDRNFLFGVGRDREAKARIEDRASGGSILLRGIIACVPGLTELR